MSRGRVILLGTSGQLGRSITRELAERGNPYELVSYTHEELDYSDTLAVANAVQIWEEQAIAYDWTMVVNCAAFTQVDLAEDTAQYRELLALNALLPAQRSIVFRRLSYDAPAIASSSLVPSGKASMSAFSSASVSETVCGAGIVDFAAFLWRRQCAKRRCRLMAASTSGVVTCRLHQLSP